MIAMQACVLYRENFLTLSDVSEKKKKTINGLGNKIFLKKINNKKRVCSRYTLHFCCKSILVN